MRRPAFSQAFQRGGAWLLVERLSQDPPFQNDKATYYLINDYGGSSVLRARPVRGLRTRGLAGWLFAFPGLPAEIE
jgi:hypothetical protein